MGVCDSKHIGNSNAYFTNSNSRQIISPEKVRAKQLAESRLNRQRSLLNGLEDKSESEITASLAGNMYIPQNDREFPSFNAFDSGKINSFYSDGYGNVPQNLNNQNFSPITRQIRPETPKFINFGSWNNKGILQLKSKFPVHSDKISALLLLSSNYLATASYDKTVKLWDLSSMTCIRVFPTSSSVLCLLEFEPMKLLYGTNGNFVDAIDVGSGRQEKKFIGHEAWVNCLVKCDQNHFASASNDTTIRIWNYYHLNCVGVLKGHKDCILAMTGVKGGRLASGGADLTINLWDWPSGFLLLSFRAHDKWIRSLISLENGLIASGSDDKTIKIWSNDKCLGILKGHSHSVRTLCDLGGGKLASGSFDKKVILWDLGRMEMEQKLEGHNDYVTGLVKLRGLGGGELVSASNDGCVGIWG